MVVRIGYIQAAIGMRDTRGFVEHSLGPDTVAEASLSGPRDRPDAQRW